MGKKIMNISLPEELHKQMKAQASLQGKSVRQYIMDLVEADLQKNKLIEREVG